MLDGKVFSSSTEASLDLVDDEEDTIIVANLAETLNVAGWCWNVSTLAENGLDDEASGITRGSLLLEKELQLAKGPSCEL